MTELECPPQSSLIVQLALGSSNQQRVRRERRWRWQWQWQAYKALIDEILEEVDDPELQHIWQQPSNEPLAHTPLGDALLLLLTACRQRLRCVESLM